MGVAIVASVAACSSEGGVFDPSERLTPAVHAALDSLILEEWSAEARYSAVLQHFGNVSPFRELRPAQGERANVLQRVYLRYGYFPPVNPHRITPLSHVQPLTAGASRGGTLAEACVQESERERATLGRYDRLLAQEPPPLVTSALEVNRRKTINHDVPAMERCR